MCCFRDSFSSGIYFWTYEEIASRLKRQDSDSNDKHALAVIIAGGIAGKDNNFFTNTLLTVTY